LIRHFDAPVGTVVMSPFRGEEASLLIFKSEPYVGANELLIITTTWLDLLTGEVFVSYPSERDAFPESFKVLLPSKRVDRRW
jgi:hypothetical protein